MIGMVYAQYKAKRIWIVKCGGNTMGIFTYTFIPSSIYCAIPVTMDIEITQIETPVFAEFEPLCPNSPAPVLPMVSENGVRGTWNPDTIETSKQGTFIFSRRRKLNKSLSCRRQNSPADSPEGYGTIRYLFPLT